MVVVMAVLACCPNVVSLKLDGNKVCARASGLGEEDDELDGHTVQEYCVASVVAMFSLNPFSILPPLIDLIHLLITTSH
jgi:hypothetical protein